ncbi:GHH signature containing HNH/Endo VII superfamily nuclease toxin [Fictibacillus solisalsi]|uniref:GHH signature containing HNH/Endo VII superfamily nuclease toxin n=1 Tax=Fictibacillus solisalsi TaxID=459525 RepID=A0A1G9YIK6_9BACL|nr:pre-toxin TG domain-containing protein [Fictibacillus solisalsi]SDN08732.1 GHH signature containing HNH/Endo VII superfamily nuclease toxin [Fictibacillus solisalsi]
MEIKIEPNRLASLSKRMLEHQNRAKNLQHSLERETEKASSILSRSEFPPPFSGQISAVNGSIKETSQTIVHTLEYQAAWLSYFAHKASGADNVPLSLTQATAILAKYDDRFKDPGKTDGIDAGKLAKDAAGELSGIYDAQRAATGIDPATGEKISGWGRVLAGGMFVFGLTPIGKGVKAFKVVRTADKVIGVTKEGQAARRVVGSADVIGLGNKKVAVGEKIIAQRAQKSGLDITPKITPYKSLSRAQQKKIMEKIENRTVTKEEYKRYQWDKRFSKRRAAGVNQFWKQEKKRIIDGEPPTRNWTNEQKQEILIGKKPKHNGQPVIGHHTYNAMNYPHISNKGELIYPVTGKEHLKGWHGGSYSKNAPGKPVNPNYLEEF